MLLRKTIKTRLNFIASIALMLGSVFFLSNGAEASGSWTFNSPGQTTWTVPAGVNRIKVQLWGAGGAGGSGKIVSSVHYPGMGGGAGSYGESTISVSPGDQFVIDVGQGGRSFSNATSTQGGFTVIRKLPLTSGVGGIPDGSSSFMIESGPGSGGVSYVKSVPTTAQTITISFPGVNPQSFSVPAFTTDTSVAIAGGSATDCYGNPTKLYNANSASPGPNPLGYYYGFYHGEHGVGQIGGSLYLVQGANCTPAYYLTPLMVTTQAVVDFYTANGKASMSPWVNDIGGGGDVGGFLIAGTGNIYYTGTLPTFVRGHPGGFPKYFGSNIPLGASNGGNGPQSEVGGIASNSGHGTDINIDGASPSAGGGGAENGLGGYGGNGRVVISDVSNSSYIDIGLRVKEQGVSSPTPIAIESNNAAIVGYDFGGMYGSKSGEENPLTGTLGCPAGVGYVSSQIVKILPSFNSNLNYCYRPNSTAGGAEAEFGGMYVSSTNNSHNVNNPLTGALSCPSGYTASPVFGFKIPGTIFNPGYTLRYCYKDVTAVADASRNQNDFGGMYSELACSGPSHGNPSVDNCYSKLGGTNQLYTNNPSTSAQSCQAEYTRTWMHMPSSDGDMEPGVTDIDVGYCTNANLNTSPLRITKDGTTYSVALVDIGDPAATSVQIKIVGALKALRRFVPANVYNFPDKYTTATGHCSGPSGPSSFYGSININNPYGYIASFARTQFTPILNETAPSSFSVSANSTLAKGGFGSIDFNNCPITPPNPYGTGTGSATYNVTINGSVVDTVTYTWDYAI